MERRERKVCIHRMLTVVALKIQFLFCINFFPDFFSISHEIYLYFLFSAKKMLGKTALSTLCASRQAPITLAARGIANIPAHEYHIRFDQKVGRKRPAQDVLDR